MSDSKLDVREDPSAEAEDHHLTINSRRYGDGSVDHYWSLCRPTSQKTATGTCVIQLFICALLWFMTPLILSAMRRSDASEATRRTESNVMGEFQTFHDSGWWFADKLKFHHALSADFGFYAFVMSIVFCIVIAASSLGFWLMVKRRHFHRGLFKTFVFVHTFSLFLNLTTQFPDQPGLVLSGAKPLQYLFGLAVEDAEPLFCCRLCWIWVVMFHVRDHYNKIRKLTKCQTALYSLLCTLTTTFLVVYVMSTHLAYTAMIVNTFFVAILAYFNTTLFPERILAWRKESVQAKKDRARHRVESEVMMTEAFELAPESEFEDAEQWSSQSDVEADLVPTPAAENPSNPFAQAESVDASDEVSGHNHVA